MLKEKLKQARKNIGLTQKEVAEKLGIAQQQYARWEQGQRKPKYETLEKLAEVFGTTTDALRGRDDGLEDIVEVLRDNSPTDTDKAIIRRTIEEYFQNKKQ
ncbi:TPA: helix-turn-helix transcriptional regulator [Streptococcus agalactiae]|nr:helix-turn-helix transcriptional regulator [Streptococcus agalactiae]HEN7647453.1 helix-turn-helix transcriptional regulator [Streptococcus agalactiae]